MSQATQPQPPRPPLAFEQLGIELEERKRSLAFAVNAFAEARSWASNQVGAAKDLVKSQGDFEEGPSWSLSDEKTSSLSDIIRNVQVDYSPINAWNMLTTILRFFDEERSQLQLWKVGAFNMFVACLREMISYLATAWSQMDLTINVAYLTFERYKPVANPFNQTVGDSPLNNILWEMQAAASQIEKTHKFKYVSGDHLQYSIDAKLNHWTEHIFLESRRFLREDDAKHQQTGKQLEGTWFRSLRSLENCFISNFLLAGRTNGRIARAVATRLNLETARIRAAINQMQMNLDAEIKRQKQAAEQPEPQADVKMQDILNPSFALSEFGRQIVPPAFPPLQAKAALGPSAMDISKIGGAAPPKTLRPCPVMTQPYGAQRGPSPLQLGGRAQMFPLPRTHFWLRKRQ